jgi:hypothetical protein
MEMRDAVLGAVALLEDGLGVERGHGAGVAGVQRGTSATRDPLGVDLQTHIDTPIERKACSRPFV